MAICGATFRTGESSAAGRVSSGPSLLPEAVICAGWRGSSCVCGRSLSPVIATGAGSAAGAATAGASRGPDRADGAARGAGWRGAISSPRPNSDPTGKSTAPARGASAAGGAAVSDGAGLAAFASAESAASSGRDAMPAGVSFVLFSSDMGITTDMTARSPALSAAPCPKPVQKPRAMRLFFLRLGLTPQRALPHL